MHGEKVFEKTLLYTNSHFQKECIVLIIAHIKQNGIYIHNYFEIHTCLEFYYQSATKQILKESLSSLSMYIN